MTSNDVKLIDGGDYGDVYRRLDNPQKVFKYPVSEHEIEMASKWADRNHREEENYSAGPIETIYFHTEKGNGSTKFFFSSPTKETEPTDDTKTPEICTKPLHFGLQMTNLGETTFEDCKDALSMGEIVLLYLMLVQCTLRLAGIRVWDTAWRNCMCQGKEHTFKIFLVDTEKWEVSRDDSCIIRNFGRFMIDFRWEKPKTTHLLFHEALSPIRRFLKTDFTFEFSFLDAMQASCVDLSDHFFDHEKCSVDYHDRIDALLACIKQETAKARMRLQASQARDIAYSKAMDQLRKKGKVDTPFIGDM